MAKRIQFDKRLFDPTTGLIPLRLGDDWFLYGKIIDRQGDLWNEVNLTGIAATAFFEGATVDVTATPTWTNPTAGEFSVAVSGANSLNAALNENGVSCYMTLNLSTGITTVESDEILEVKARGYEPE